MIKIYLILIIMIMSLSSEAQVRRDSAAVSQSQKTKRVKPEKKVIRYPHLYFGITGGAGPYGLNFSKDSITSSLKNSFGGGIFFELKMMKWLSIELGGNYWIISGNTSVKKYTNAIPAIDNEGYSYDHRISATKVTETDKAGLLEIPVSLKFQLTPGRWTFYMKPGAAYTMALSSTYTQTGNFAVSGYYPNWNVLLEKLPNHGFYNQSITSKKSIAIKSAMNPFVAIGIVFPAKKTNFFIEGRYYPGTVDLSKKGNGTLFEGPMNSGILGDYMNESVMEEVGKVSLAGYLITAGLRF